MRHVVMIPFEFDTTAIEQKLEAISEEQVTEEFYKLVEEHVNGVLPKNGVGYDWNPKQEPSWAEFLKQQLRQWLDDHAEEIVDEAALLLAQKAGRKKAWREILAEVKEDGK